MTDKPEKPTPDEWAHLFKVIAGCFITVVILLVLAMSGGFEALVGLAMVAGPALWVCRKGP